MYLGGESRALSIKNHVSFTQQYKIFTLKKNGYISEVELFVKMIHEMSSPTRAHLYFTQINSHFIGTIELIMYLKFLKIDFKWKF